MTTPSQGPSSIVASESSWTLSRIDSPIFPPCIMMDSLSIWLPSGPLFNRRVGVELDAGPGRLARRRAGGLAQDADGAGAGWGGRSGPGRRGEGAGPIQGVGLAGLDSPCDSGPGWSAAGLTSNGAIYRYQ
jgi:hypothetical protein